jgi:hypothetical protein
MDKDRIRGSVKQVVGSVKEVVGKVLGGPRGQVYSWSLSTPPMMLELKC